ncbi:hypothetical protein O181_099267 [Austropuccinia psidii MF-1]|uniref:BUB1 N-terminal domain-containing protein n=1 Tax=Austropuccinia psidii MF-1 TaxID=1389203 RepID=A0A9Q3PGC7_9BASI|nr:hypothetical protein [Austropuccinia psidii MF-1]
MLYEEWANAIEQDQADPQKVERIFDLGIQREAQPLTHLKKKKLLVLKRMSETNLLAQETTSGQTQNLQCKLSDSIGSLSFSDQLTQDPLRYHNSQPKPLSVVTTKNKLTNHHTANKASQPIIQKFALDLTKLYLKDGTELSLEECKAILQFPSKIWGSKPWEEEAFNTGNRSPVLYDPESGFAPSTSSEMELSEDECELQDILGFKSNFSFNLSRDDDQSMQGNESIPPLNLANISSSMNDYDNDGIVTREAIADTEISIKLDSPAQASSIAYIKAHN